MSTISDRPFRLVVPGGFEPPHSEPKSEVLPLDDGAIISSSGQNRTAIWRLEVTRSIH